MITRQEVIGALPERLTVAEAAALVGVSTFSVYRRIRAGRMGAREGRRGGRTVTLVSKRDAMAYRDERRRWRGK